MQNSLLVGLLSAAIIIATATPLAFLISRGLVRGSFPLFFAFLTTRMAPSAAIALPLYWTFTRLGLVDTYPAIVLTHVAINFAVGLWLLRVVFDSQPPILEEAAMIDGQTFGGALLVVVLPACLPGLLACFFILFLLSWNESFLASLIVGFEKRPLSSAVLSLITPQGTFWGRIAAISAVAILPAGLILAFAYIRLRLRGIHGDPTA
jgi:multiple sugar transport system permease protein